MNLKSFAPLLAIPFATLLMAQSQCPGEPPGGGDPVDCVCDGAYSVGDRVQATVDSPSGAAGIAAGATGTVVCGTTLTPPILIQWDGYGSGHDGNGFCDCPAGESAPPGTAWYVTCDEVRTVGAVDSDIE